MEGQASWVPDWTPEGARDCDWGDIEELIRGNGNVDDLKTSFKDSASISMVYLVTVSIWGRRHCTVVATFVFLKTESSYQQADSRKHIYNLAQMMRLRSSGLTLAWSRVGERWFSAINSGRLAQWTRFLKKHHNLEASALLLLLRPTVSDENHQDSATVDPEILRTDITVCNILARLDRILYQQTCSGIHTFSGMGWCRRGIKEGDLIIKCLGVQIPLIVRSCSDMNNRVQIKSIAHTPSMLFFHGVPRPEVNGTSELEEFHVY